MSELGVGWMVVFCWFYCLELCGWNLGFVWENGKSRRREMLMYRGFVWSCEEFGIEMEVE